MHPVMGTQSRTVTATSATSATSPPNDCSSAPPNRYVGRTAEAGALDDCWRQGARLVSVVGPAGIGKTRFAGHSLGHGRVPWDRAALCELAEARDMDDMSRAVLRSCGLSPARLDGTPDPLQFAGHALGTLGEALVVLDNLEHLLPDAADAVARWMELAPSVRLLVTSRCRLGLEAEHRIELGPLRTPPDDQPAARSEATELFVDRVRRGNPQYTPDAHERTQIAELVHRLDGLPLAIEMAASRVQLLGVPQLLRQLREGDAPLDTVRFDSPDPRGRDRTLRDALQRSWNLLAPNERRALEQCSVFRGGFDIEAVSSIVRVDGASPVDVVRSLRDKSLVRTLQPGRFGLYENVRELAAAHLDAEARQQTFERHAAYYVEAADAGELSAEDADNLQLALERLTEEAFDERALRAAAGLGELAEEGPPPSALSLLERVASRGLTLHGQDESTLPQTLLVRALMAYARGLWRRGDAARTDQVLCHVLAVARRHPNLDLERHARTLRGEALLYLDRLDEARHELERALELHMRARQPSATAQSMVALGIVLCALGEHATARARAQDGLALARRHSEPGLQAKALCVLASVAQDEGELEDARVKYRRAVQLAGRCGVRRTLSVMTAYYGILHFEQGRLREARDLLDSAIGIERSLGNVLHEGFFRGIRAAVHASLDRIEDAEADAREAEAQVAADPLSAGLVHLHLGHLDLARMREAARQGDTQEAQQLRARAMQRLEQQAPDEGSGGGAYNVDALRARSDDARTALRILQRALEAEPSERPRVPPSESGPAHVLRLSHEGSRFSFGTATDVSLARKPLLRRLLLALSERRVSHPGESLSNRELFAIGWPGENLDYGVLRNRLHVALASLRRLGLREALQRTSEGYRLAPEVSVRYE
jgi:predicted ATPase